MAADLNKITIPGMIIQLPDLFYLMRKKKNLEETIIQCINLDWKYTTSVIQSAIFGNRSSRGQLDGIFLLEIKKD